jgi:DNA-binding MarR family transcriptional regulator
MIDMNMAATKTTLTATFWLIRACTTFLLLAARPRPSFRRHCDPGDRGGGESLNQRFQIVSILSINGPREIGIPLGWPLEVTSVKPKTGHDVVDSVLYAAHRIRTAADARLRDRGLSLPAYKLLRALENSEQSMREVSDALHVSPRTVTDMIDGLEARGLVARGPHPADRRVTLLRLTPEGQRQLAAAAALAEQSHRAAMSALSSQEQDTLRGLLDRVAPESEPARDLASHAAR